MAEIFLKVSINIITPNPNATFSEFYGSQHNQCVCSFAFFSLLCASTLNQIVLQFANVLLTLSAKIIHSIDMILPFYDQNLEFFGGVVFFIWDFCWFCFTLLFFCFVFLFVCLFVLFVVFVFCFCSFFCLFACLF